MLAKVHSGAVYGVDAYAVEIEACPAKLQRSWVNTRRRKGFPLRGAASADKMVGRPGRGDPQTVIVGLPDALRLRSGQAAVKESPSTTFRVNDKDRVNTAILNFHRRF